VLSATPELEHDVLSHVFGGGSLAEERLGEADELGVMAPKQRLEGVLLPRAQTVEDLTVAHGPALFGGAGAGGLNLPGGQIAGKASLGVPERWSVRMSMENESARWEALARYVAGESTTAEAEDVRRWLAASPGREDLIAALARVSAQLRVPPPADVDVEHALGRVLARLHEPDVRSLGDAREHAARSWRTRGLRIAAALALLLGGTLLWRVTRAGHGGSFIAAGRTHATLVGRVDSLRLPDGSRVVLGPASELALGPDFGVAQRDVRLQGEALFDVRHDDAHPFRVRAGAVQIQDIGTTFVVRTDGEGVVHVAVTAGRVLVQGVILQEGDRGLVGPDGRAVAQRGTLTAHDLAWTQGRLVFDNAPLERVQSDLRRWYGVELVVADRSLARRHLTATFAGEPVQEVLKVIALALGATIQQRGDTAVVRVRSQAAAPR